MSWIYETLYPNIKLGIKGKLIYGRKTPHQNLKVYNNSHLGNVLFLDGAIQTTEKDEFIYHEMLTHPVLLTHPHPENILVIGAGDGGVLREILKHKIKKITLVEIDDAVIRVSKKYLPSLSRGAFSNRKVKVIIDDGAKFVEKVKEKFDIVIIDSPDPIGVAKILFSKKFYEKIFSVLHPKGIMIRQAGSTVLQEKELKENYHILKQLFPFVTLQLVAIPTYIGGFFSFLIASKKINPLKVPYSKILNRYNILNLKTKCYNPEIHFASMQLPNYVKEIIR
jgi:spermidine synthase